MRLKLLIAFLCGFSLMPLASAFQHAHGEEGADFDKRKNRAGGVPISAEKKLAIEKLRSLDAEVVLDEVTGAPTFVAAGHHFLFQKGAKNSTIAPDALGRFAVADPHRVTKAFVHEHKGVFGFGAEGLDKARIARDYSARHNGLRTTVWQQEVDGVPVFDAYFVSHATKNGELVNVSSRFLSDPSTAADRGVKNRRAVLQSPPISPARAVSLAADHFGEDVETGGVLEAATERLPGNIRKFKAEGLPGDTYVGLVWLPMSGEEMRLCWQITLTAGEHKERFLVLVDAQDGEIIVQYGLTRYLSNATYNVFTRESPTPMMPGTATPGTTQPPLVSRELVTLSALNTNASPLGWIPDGGNTTLGNNVEAQLDLDGDDVAEEARPQATGRVFDFPFNPSQPLAGQGDAAVVQAFYWCNWMHDKLYELGFTEEAGNFQMNNFGKGGYGGDPVKADVQDNYGGIAANGARFFTDVDGVPGRMDLSVFNGPDPDRDVAFDAQMVLHEYTHGLSDRLVGGGLGMAGLTATQSRGMAEGWSDFYALALLSSATNDVNGVYPFAAYVGYKGYPQFEQNYYFGIRRYPYSTDLLKNPLTFKDIDPLQLGNYPSVPKTTGPVSSSTTEFHNLGEVWCVTLWEARANLIAKYGFATGNQMILQLVTDGIKLCPPRPNFIQARDAILQADQVNHSGANHPELWMAFAKRGLGFFASAPYSTTTEGVVESFALPDALSVLPDAGLVASGMVGGPFLPNVQTYVLSNIGPGTVTWSVTGMSNWISVSNSSGSLPSHASQSVSVSINQGVSANLAEGKYTNTIRFLNQTTGLEQTRTFILLIGQPESFTEFFTVNDFDLSNQSLTFTPDGSVSEYSVCRSAITNFPSDPAGGIPLGMGDDSSAKIVLAEDVAVYSSIASEVYVGSNGYITWGNGDSSYDETLEDHFGIARVSALFRDLIPATNSISWKQFTNRVAVTYTNVIEYGTSRTNNFQIELFFDGRIRISYLQMGTRNGLVGLSKGAGIPESFIESDLNNFIECAPALVVTVPASAFEGSGNLPLAGKISISAPLLENRTIQLFWNDNTEITLPSQIVLTAGQTNAFFDITVVNDADFDGTRPVTITASAAGFQNGRATIQVHDDDMAVLQMTLPGSALEGDGSIFGTVAMESGVTSDDVKVALFSDSPARLSVPAFVTIPAGQSSVGFEAFVADNQVIESNQTVTVSAGVTGWEEGEASTLIIDNEDFNLRLYIPSQASEGNGVMPGAGSIHLSGAWSDDLLVDLSSSAGSAVSVPAMVLIPQGQTFVTFDLTIGNNAQLNPAQVVEITATAEGFNEAVASITVADDETPPVPARPRPEHLSLNNPTSVDLQWDSAIGEGVQQFTNGGFETGSFLGWTLTTNVESRFTIFKTGFTGNGNITNFAGAYSLAMHPAGPGTQTLSRQLTLPTSQLVSVSWADLIQNTAPAFSAQHQFRVELRQTNDTLLQVLYRTDADDPLVTEWTARHLDITQYRGQTVKLVFVLQTTAAQLEVFLDEISVRGANPPTTLHDVYLGTNAIPGPGDLLGSTTNLFWTLPELEPFVTYYWQIVSHRLGEASGPVWQFRTVPTISVSNLSISEGHSGSTSAIFELQMSIPSPDPVSFSYSTLAGTASAGVDFVETNGTVQFAPGETNKTFEVIIVGDGDYEGAEVFYVVFSDLVNAVVLPGQVSCTILEDDPILFPISNKTVNEGSLLTFVAQAGSPAESITESITDFEGISLTNGNGRVMFREPLQGNTTYLENTPSVAVVTNQFPAGHAGAVVMAVSCNFKSTTNGWLRLTTAPGGTVLNPLLPNPTVSFNQSLQFDVFTDRPFRLGLGLRETGTTNPIGADGGSNGTVEFVGVTNKVIGPNTPMPTRSISTGSWQRVSFAIPTEPVTGLDGNGVLQSSSGKGALAHLAIVPTGGSGVYKMFFDNFSVVYTNQLTFALSNAPAGASIHPQTGVFSWTPSENQGPGTYEMTVYVTDGGTNNAARTFTVSVNEVNSIPTMSSVTNRVVPENALLSFAVTASDPDVPVNTLSYSLDTAPVGASIDPESGVFTWTPAETDGPGTNTVIVRVTDNGSPALSQPATFFIFVTEVNSPPSLSVIADQVVYPNSSLVFPVIATDPDLPTNGLTFSLTGTPPAGATIHPSSGQFTWNNISAVGGSTNQITVRVQDNSSPLLSATRTFAVIVIPAPVIQSVQLQGEDLILTWTTISGRTYRVQQSVDLLSWSDVGDIAAVGSTASTTRPIEEASHFYRILVVP